MLARTLVLLAAAALVAAACGAGGPAEPTASVVSRGTPAAATPGSARPPAASAAAGGATAALGIGSYCWSEPGRTGVCVDSVGPVTASQPLSVARGAMVSVANPVQGTPVGSAVVTAWSGLTSMPVQGGQLVWLLGGGSSSLLPVVVAASGLDFAADLAAGRYVVDIALTYPQGSVNYGLLLEVR